MSPRHAAFEERADGTVALVDLGSEEGTFVETRRIRDAVELAGDEEVCFGWVFAETCSTRPAARRKHRTLAFAAIGLGVFAVAGALVGILNVGGADPPAAAPRPDSTLAEPAGESTLAEPSAEETLPFAGGPTTDAPSPTETDAPPGTTGESASEEESTSSEESAGSDSPVVFADDFSDPASGWEVFDGDGASAQYENDAFVMRVKQSSYFATADSGREFERPIVRVAATANGSTYSAFGILCRYRDQKNFDLLAAGTDGTAAILHNDEGRLTVLTNGGEWLSTPKVPKRATEYALRATCTDERLGLSVNGKPVLSVRSPAPSGNVGLFMAGEGAIQFDDLRVTEEPIG